MGGGAGGGYSSSTAGLHDNAAALAGAFPMTKSGYFGMAGLGKARLIFSDDPAADGLKFFTIASKGAKITQLFHDEGPKPGRVKGLKASFPNGDFVTFRPTTATSKNPGVQLTVNSAPFKSQKIHFEKKGK